MLLPTHTSWSLRHLLATRKLLHRNWSVTGFDGVCRTEGMGCHFAKRTPTCTWTYYINWHHTYVHVYTYVHVHNTYTCDYCNVCVYRSGDHGYIGSCTTTLQEITPKKGGEVCTLDIVNPNTKKKKKNTNSGTLNFVSLSGMCLCMLSVKNVISHTHLLLTYNIYMYICMHMHTHTS